MSMINVLDIGDLARYNGCRKLTSIMYTSMYKYLTKGKYYKILDTLTVDGERYYRIFHDFNNDLWYPKDCFESSDSREYMIKKYNLK